MKKIVIISACLMLFAFGKTWAQSDIVVFSDNAFSIEITNGDNTPDLADDTDFGVMPLSSSDSTHVFTIASWGTDDINVNSVSVTPGTYFTVNLDPAPPFGLFLPWTFTITFQASTAPVGVYDATITIDSDDPDENPFTFAVRAEVTGAPPPLQPEINLKGNGMDIADGDSSPNTADDTDFGSITLGGAPVVHIFRIQNTGDELLNVTDIGLSGAGASAFSLGALDPASPVAPFEYADFTLTFDPTTAGTFNATVSIANDDSDENPYTFAIRGVATTPPPPPTSDVTVRGNGVLITNGDTSPSTADGTDFGITPPGQGFPINHYFVVKNTGNDPLNVADITLTQLGMEFFISNPLTPASPIPPGDSATVWVSFVTATNGTFNATLTIDSDEPDFTFLIRGKGEIPVAQDIYVAGNGLEIINGDATPNTEDGTDLGPIALGSGTSKLLNIDNFGNTTLHITNIVLSGPHASDFTIGDMAPVGMLPPGELPFGNGTFFSLDFNPSAIGLRQATITITSDDPDESPYTIKIQGTGTVALSPWYEDTDGDTYGNPSVSQMAASQPSGYVADNTDCDDSNSGINPAATEVCNSVDDDCDGNMDEGVLSTFYTDADGDGFGDPIVSQTACTAPMGYVADNTDCDDSNSGVNPAAAEVCNSVDDDCDGNMDEGVQSSFYADADGDGFGDPLISQTACTAPMGYVADNNDCDDTDNSVHLGAIEVCNGIDDNCNGTIDEGVQSTFYADADGDGYGNPAVPQNACTAPFGYVADNNDCDDTNNLVNSGATEVCNGIDDDCNGDIDESGAATTWYADADGDSFGNPAISQPSCTQPIGYVADGTDCNDTNIAINPSASELCDGLDNDCDGTNDDGLVFQNYYLDGDGDSFGTGAAVNACQSPGANFVLVNDDCDDANPSVNPSISELCNGIDDDCDNGIDDGLVFQNYYLDGDGDSFGAGTAVNACQPPVGSYVLVNGDCDDANAAIFPGATELCDGLDNDCDGTNDDGLVFQNYYLDGDGDSFGAGAAVNACQPPVGSYVLVNGDCNDANANINPSMSELCDGLDNDCDGTNDNGLVFQNYYLDGDGDSFGAGAAVNACQPPVGSYVLVNGDCDDANDAIFPGATELCDGLDNDCDTQVDDGLVFQNYYLDGDGDAFGAGVAVNACQPPVGSYVLVNVDCNDANANIFPGATELCDGLDNDCDTQVDDGLVFQNYYLDGDGDAFGAGVAVNACQPPVGSYVLVNGDCNDANAAIFPGATELCDGLDNDCDGTNDDGLTFQNYYLDGDGDSFGAGVAVNACQPPVGNYVLVNGDCNDANANINPSMPELCDGLDNDCDGTNDDGLVFQNYYLDGDGDAFGAGVAVNACQPPVGSYVLVNGDCNDANANINPSMPELCDGLDNDCDTQVDDGLVFQNYYLDGDGDSFGTGAAVNACQPPVGSYVLVNGDCNDANAAIFPGATELCDGLDNDCDGTNDDGLTFQNYYLDGDGDSFGAGTAVNACQPPVGSYVLVNGDCDDANANINPSAAELCNGVDDDCDGDIDETGAAAIWYADADADGFGNPALSQTACTQPTGFVANNDDCNDSNSQINPTATEVCNGVDDDCDNLTDTTDPNLVDNIQPAVNCKNYAVVLDASGTVSISPNDVFLNGSDNCGSVNLVSVLPNIFNCSNIGNNTVTLTINDGNGNQNSCSATVSVSSDLTASAGNDAAICNGQSTTLGASATGGSGSYSYVWSPGQGLNQMNIPNPVATPSTTTTYTVLVTDANGCTASDAILVSVNAAPVASISTNSPICQGGDILLSEIGGSTGVSWAWSGPNSFVSNLQSPTIANATTTNSGTYTVIVTAGNNCTASATADVTVYLSPVGNAGLDTTICLGDTVQLMATGGAGNIPNGYQWSPSASLSSPFAANPSAFPTSTTTYTVTVTDGNNCTDTDQVTVTVNPLPSLGGVTAACDASLLFYTVHLTASGNQVTASTGTVINNGGGSWTVNDVPIGQNIVINSINSGTGCEASTTIVAPNCNCPAVNAPIAPTPDVEICANETIPALAVTVGAGETVDWYDAATGGVLLAQNTTSYTSVAAGNFYAETRVTANGCLSAVRTHLTLTIHQNPNADAGSMISSCTGATVQLDGSGSSSVNGGLSFSWSPSASLNSPTLVNPLATPSATTIYQLIVTDAEGCTDEAQVGIIITPVSPPVAGQNQTVCQGASIPALAVTVGTGETADWYDAASGGTLLAQGTTSYTPTAAGIFYAQTRAIAGGCTSPSRTPVTLTLNPAPTASVAGATAICEGESTPLDASASTGLAPLSFAWDNGLASSSNPIATPATTTTYTITITDGNGCTASASTTVEVNTKPSIAAGQTACDPSLLTYSFGVSLTGGDQLAASPGTSNGSGTSYIVTVPSGQDVTLTATNSATTCFSELTVTGLDCTCPTVNAPVSNGDKTICEGEPTPNLSVSVGANETADWYDTATGGTAIASGTTSYLSSQNTVGFYTFYVETRNTTSGCTSTTRTPISLTINALPTASITGDDAICANEQATLTATGGTAFLWSTTETSASIDVSPSASTSYSVTVTDGNGCKDDAAFGLTVNALPTASITGDDAICASEQATLTATGGTTFLWSTTETSASIDVSPSASTSYSVTVTDGNGCKDDAAFSLTVNALPTASIAGDDAICANGTATLTATGGTTFLWSTTETSASIDVSPSASTSYSVTVTDGNGCEDTESFNVAVNPLPTASITGDDAICASEMATLTATGGTAFLWSTTETSASIDVSPSASTSYSVTVTDGNGCKDDVNFDLTINPLPMADAGTDAVFCSNSNGTQLNAGGSSGAAPLSFDWSPSGPLTASDVADPLAEPISDTMFILTVTDVNGCQDVDSVAVSLEDAPVISMSSTSPVCANEDLELSEHGSDAVSWAWSGPNGFFMTEQNPMVANADVLPGDYSLVITDANGCRDTTDFAVSLSGGVAFVANFLTGSVACEGDTVHFIEISQTTTLPDGFVWDFGDGSMSTERDPAHVFSDAGTYLVSVMVSEAGCENFSIEKEITVNNCRTNEGKDGFNFYQISPNITTSKFRLEADLVERGLLQVEIVDINGKFWLNESRKDIKHFDEVLTLTAPGVYFVHLRSLQGQKVLKVVVVRA